MHIMYDKISQVITVLSNTVIGKCSEREKTDTQGEREVRVTPGITHIRLCVCVCACECVCGIRLSACGNFTPTLAPNNSGGLHTCECVLAASIVLSECYFHS